MLCNAIREKSQNQIDAFIAKGLNLNFHDKRGMTPLSTAVINSNLTVCKQLIMAGSDINFPNKDEYKNTPLLLAAKNGHK